MNASAELRVNEYVQNGAGRLVSILQDLVRIPSENKAPDGSERGCQEYVSSFLKKNGWNPRLYTPLEAPGIKEHAIYWPDRNYADRPNVGAVLKGAGSGRSLVLSGHIDTVPAGSYPWTHDPFGGAVEGNRLYGLGSNDMKAGIATSLFAVEALRELGITLRGDLVFETVVDEEFGGVNGTLAGRLMGFNADAAVITEPTGGRVCPAQRGGRTAHIRFSAPHGGILGGPSVSVVEQLRVFLNAVQQFADERRRSAIVPDLYAHLPNAVPVSIARIHTAPWGTSEPSGIPHTCQVEFFWQAMPGETLEQMDGAFFSWLDKLVGQHSDVFPVKPEVVFPIRWLPPSAIDMHHPLVQELAACVGEVRGSAPLVQGIEGPCDMYVFHEFGMPAVLWGARGGNTHNPDEFVEIDSLVEAAAVLLTFVCRWCGVASKS
jgi:acetylornithine deacetylase